MDVCVITMSLFGYISDRSALQRDEDVCDSKPDSLATFRQYVEVILSLKKSL